MKRWVRAHALALAAVNPEKARPVLERLARSDEEPAVQRTARRLLLSNGK